MKKLLALAVLSLALVGLSTSPASAWCCCFKAKYCACAAQYNAFSPFCLNTVYGGKCGHCKCFHVADCGCNGPGYCGPMCGDGACEGGNGGVVGQLPAAGGAPGAPAGQPAPKYQGPMPNPLPGGGSSMLMPQQMPYGMVQPTGFQPMYYGYPPQMPMAAVAAPTYWNAGN
jgi:hypothetical protein